MASASNAVQVLIDLWLSILKVLGRPAIQQQLLIGLLAGVLAWLLARWIIKRMDRQDAARRQALRARIVADAQTNLAEIDQRLDHGDTTEDRSEGAPDSNAENESTGNEGAYYTALLQDEDALAEAVNRQRGAGSRFRALVRQILFPALAIVFLYAGYVYAVSADWYSGLLVNFITLFAFYFVYRLSFGIAYAVGSSERIAYYQHRLFGPLVVIIVILLALNTVGDLRAVRTATLLPLEEGWLTLGAVFAATVGFYFWIMTISLLKDLIQAGAAWLPRVDSGSLNAGLTLLQYSLIALGIFGVFRTLQVNTATIAAITGGLSIGIGFALQDVLKNFLGGLIVLFEGTVRPGDWVEIDNTEGEIDKISIRSTVVRTYDGVAYIVPNQDWLDSTVTTFTRYSRRVRVHLSISVSADADPVEVRALLDTTVRQHPEVIVELPTLTPLIAFNHQSSTFVALFWIEDAKIKGRIAAEVRLMIRQALHEHGIEIQSGPAVTRTDVAPIVQRQAEAAL